MSIDQKASPDDLPNKKQAEDRNIWHTNSTDSQDDFSMERKAIDIAQGADRLAWVALWLSVLAVVISVAGGAIALTLP